MPPTILTLLINFVLPIVIAVVGSSWFSSLMTAKKMKSNDILESLNRLDYKIDLLKAENNRARILKFGEEIRRSIHHDLEEFNDVLLCIKAYESFCEKHPDYKNNRCKNAVKLIEETYAEAYKKNDF